MPRRVRPEVLALLADVKENPDDLTPWLVLTDWLEENGDEADRARAEYCRLCFDKLGKKTYASDWEKGERRRELFRTWKVHWLGPLLEMSPVVVKGLVRLEDPSSFLALVPQILEQEENWVWVPELSTNLSAAEMARPEVARLLSRLIALELWRNRVDDQELTQLAACPALAGLRKLQLRFVQSHFGYEGVMALSESPYLSGLTSLTIHADYHPSEQVQRLLRQHFGKKLTVNW